MDYYHLHSRGFTALLHSFGYENIREFLRFSPAELFLTRRAEVDRASIGPGMVPGRPEKSFLAVPCYATPGRISGIAFFDQYGGIPRFLISQVTGGSSGLAFPPDKGARNHAVTRDGTFAFECHLHAARNGAPVPGLSLLSGGKSSEMPEHYRTMRLSFVECGDGGDAAIDALTFGHGAQVAVSENPPDITTLWRSSNPAIFVQSLLEQSKSAYKHIGQMLACRDTRARYAFLDKLELDEDRQAALLCAVETAELREFLAGHYQAMREERPLPRLSPEYCIDVENGKVMSVSRNGARQVECSVVPYVHELLTVGNQTFVLGYVLIGGRRCFFMREEQKFDSRWLVSFCRRRNHAPTLTARMRRYFHGVIQCVSKLVRDELAVVSCSPLGKLYLPGVIIELDGSIREGSDFQVPIAQRWTPVADTPDVDPDREGMDLVLAVATLLGLQLIDDGRIKVVCVGAESGTTDSAGISYFFSSQCRMPHLDFQTNTIDDAVAQARLTRVPSFFRGNCPTIVEKLSIPGTSAFLSGNSIVTAASMIHSNWVQLDVSGGAALYGWPDIVLPLLSEAVRCREQVLSARFPAYELVQILSGKLSSLIDKNVPENTRISAQNRMKFYGKQPLGLAVLSAFEHLVEVGEIPSLPLVRSVGCSCVLTEKELTFSPKLTHKYLIAKGVSLPPLDQILHDIIQSGRIISESAVNGVSVLTVTRSEG